MNLRLLYGIFDPDNRDPEARVFRVVHHAMVAAGIAIMLAETVAPIQATYGVALAAGFYIVAAFFCAEYVLRLTAAPESPIGLHCGPLRARLLWVVSVGGVFDLVSALPGLVAIVQGPSVGLFGFVWAFKYVRYSPGLAAIGRDVSNARQALLSVLLGFATVLLTASSVAYLLERDANPDAFGSIPAALWWGIVTMTTTGYGDVVPQTVGGRVLGGVLMIGGILVFALWAGILASGYAQELRRREFLRTWELVAKVPFFHNIGAALIAEVAELLRPRDFPPGAVIMRRGAAGDRMYFIIDGEVEVQLASQTVILGGGQFFGELALLTGAPRNATVVAVDACTLLALDIVDFHGLLGRHPELARIIREEADQRLADTPPSRRAEAALAVDESA
jgi:voltage-gated potassium channel